MALIRNNQDQFSRLIMVTANDLNLDPLLIEKDYWAVEALRAIYLGFDIEINNAQVRIQPLFKGGTSLSKAFGIIARFSEDVDLLVPLPYGQDNEYSQSQRANILKQTIEVVSQKLGIAGNRKGGSKGIDRHWLYPYNSVISSFETQIVAPTITVEVTVMGGSNPASLSRVSALVTDHAQKINELPKFDDLTPVFIETLAPERTLVEKLAMLHDAATQAMRGDSRRLANAGRHYYDIGMLLKSNQVRTKLNAPWVAEIAADADLWSSKGNSPFTPRPPEGFAASPAFTDAAILQLVKPRYLEVLSWVWGEKLSLEKCIQEIQGSAEIL